MFLAKILAIAALQNLVPLSVQTLSGFESLVVMISSSAMTISTPDLFKLKNM